MLDHLLRPWKDRLVGPLARRLDHVSPDATTLLALVVGLAAAGAAATRMNHLALGLWLLNRFLDGLDGAIAREQGRQSDFGGYLDLVLDFVVYAAVPIGLYLAHPGERTALGLALLLASFYVNAASWMYLSAILEKRHAGAAARGELTTVTMPPGVVGGTETVLFYAAFLAWPDRIDWLFPAMALAVALGVGRRLRWARRHLAASPSGPGARS